jgi:hypothetical protein
MNKIIKVSNKNFEIVRVPGNGTCLYHSIVESSKIVNFDKLSIFRDGYELRLDIIEKLRNILRNVINEKSFILNHSENNNLNFENLEFKKSILNSKESHFKTIIKDIYVMLCLERGIHQIEPESISNINNKELQVYLSIIILDIRNREWGGATTCKIISVLFDLCIYFYNVNAKKFDIISSDININTKCKENNTIYIYYNGYDHYDSLKKL